jgi:hypothetical protein
MNNSKNTDYENNGDRQKFIDKMVEDGYKVILPAANELQLDIDNEEQFKKAEDMLGLLSVMLQREDEDWVVSWKEGPSKSGLPHRHITVKMPFPIDNGERIALQAICGSDPKRELLSLIRLRKGLISPILFFEKEKVATEIDMNWEISDNEFNLEA